MTEWITEAELEEKFNEMLDDCYDPFHFGGVDYMPSDVLKSTDPVHHELGMQDYADHLASEDRQFVKGYTYPEDYPENE